MKRGKWEKRFFDAALAMRAPSEISEPVKTEFGYHIIRLHEKQASKLQPFDEIKAEIVKGLRDKYTAAYRQEQIGKIISDPSLKLHEEAIDHYYTDIGHEAAAGRKE